VHGFEKLCKVPTGIAAWLRNARLEPFGGNDIRSNAPDDDENAR